MTNNDLLYLIEGAAREKPYCEQCGEPTVIVERDGALVLQCASLRQPRTRLQSLLRLDFASLHTRAEIADLSAAA